MPFTWAIRCHACTGKQRLLLLTNEMPQIRTFGMKVGDKASVTRVFTEADVRGFADITWDTNPLHIDNEFAKNTRFSKPVVNGVFSLGLVFYSSLLYEPYANVYVCMYVCINFIFRR